MRIRSDGSPDGEPRDLGAQPTVCPRLVEVPLHSAAPRFGEPVRKAWLLAKAGDRRGKPGRVVRIDQRGRSPRR